MGESRSPCEQRHYRSPLCAQAAPQRCLDRRTLFDVSDARRSTHVLLATHFSCPCSRGELLRFQIWRTPFKGRWSLTLSHRTQTRLASSSPDFSITACPLSVSKSLTHGGGWLMAHRRACEPSSRSPRRVMISTARPSRIRCRTYTTASVVKWRRCLELAKLGRLISRVAPIPNQSTAHPADD